MILANALKNILRTGRAARNTPLQPKVSVLIPAYNHERYIADTVQSIWDQSYPNLEIVAVDDVSSDDTFAVLRELSEGSPIPMTVTRNAVNRGPAFTLNQAASLASGDLFILFSSDDLLPPDRLERQVTFLESNPSIMILYGNGRGFDDRSNQRLGVCHPPEVIKLLAKTAEQIYLYLITNKNCIFVHTALMRRSLFEAVGGYDETMLAEDWTLNVRIFKYLAYFRQKHHAFQNDHVFEYRLHEGQNFRNDERQLESKWRVIEHYTPDGLKFQASNNIILEHLHAPWCRLSEIPRAHQLLRLAKFHASLGEWPSVLSLCAQISSLDVGNEVAHSLAEVAKARYIYERDGMNPGLI